MPIRSENYSLVSKIYPHLMRKISYEYWADYLFLISKNFIKRDAFVLELAAGNCTLAKFYNKKYKNIIATDLSFSMLNSSADKSIKKVLCNMISLPFKNSFNLIFSCFDSVNYLLIKKDVNKLFANINNLLSDKGIFTFDVSLENNSRIHIKEPIREGKYKGITYKHTTSYDPKKRIHKNSFEIKLKDKTFTEVHRQKIYPFIDYFKLLQKNELFVLHCYDAFTFKDATENSNRVQFVVKKMR
ncbi:MAG: hypothetical protein COW08_09640 [Ignavibacteriales bacterium CG12_big_fil_rev_8_21_14_0_65_30_8]|nr:MAG: hypothetical protein COW08_09640 [Ignavibacteriales bacterium CG12_big_fil_rev_8_21_14_0_65_30_8]